MTQKRVLITGSSRGIGRAIAEVLAGCGYRITLHGHTFSAALEQSLGGLRENGVDHTALAFDIRDRVAAKQILDNDIATGGAYYGVVLAAGIHADAAFPAMEDQAWDSVIETNLHGFYNVLKPSLLPMIQLRTGGRIVAITSISGILGNRGQVNYSATKAGIMGAARSLAQEVAKRKITVNCVAPGAIDTEMLPTELRARMIEEVPMQRLGTPAEVAGAVQYLFSDTAAYMTGQTLVLNGGLF